MTTTRWFKNSASTFVDITNNFWVKINGIPCIKAFVPSLETKWKRFHISSTRYNLTTVYPIVYELMFAHWNFGGYKKVSCIELENVTYINAHDFSHVILPPKTTYNLTDHGIDTRAQSSTRNNGSPHFLWLKVDLHAIKELLQKPT